MEEEPSEPVAVAPSEAEPSEPSEAPPGPSMEPAETPKPSEPSEPQAPMKKEKTLAQVRCRKCNRYFTGRALLYNHRKECGLDIDQAKRDVREHLGEDQVGVSRTNKKRAKPAAKPSAEPAPEPVDLLRPPPPEPSRPVFMHQPPSPPPFVGALELLREQRRLHQAALREEQSRRLSLLARDAF